MAAGALALKRHKGAVQPPRYVWSEVTARNLLTYSEEQDNAAWTKTGVTVSTNAVVDSQGELTADKLVEDTGTSLHGSRGLSLTNVNHEPITVYAEVKAAERTLCDVWAINSSQTIGYGIRVDLTDGSVGSSRSVGGVTMTDYRVDDLGNGWYGVWVTAKTATTSTRSVLVNAIATGTATTTSNYTGDGSSGIYVARCAAIEDVQLGFPYYKTTDSVIDDERRRTQSTTAWTRNAVVSRNYFAHSNDLLSWSGGSTYGAATNIIGPQRVKMFDISDAAPASWTSITNLFDLDYDGVSVVHCSWYVKKDAVANTTRFPGWRISFTNGYSATCDFRLDTSTGEVNVQTGAQQFDDYGAELVTADGGDEYWHCWFDCTPNSPGATNVYVVHYPAIGASSNMAVYSSAAQGTVTSGGYRKDYLSAGAGEPLPYVGDTEGITTTPIGRYVPTNNVIYLYKGAVQSTKLALERRVQLVRARTAFLLRGLTRNLIN